MNELSFQSLDSEPGQKHRVLVRGTMGTWSKHLAAFCFIRFNYVAAVSEARWSVKLTLGLSRKHYTLTTVDLDAHSWTSSRRKEQFVYQVSVQVHTSRYAEASSMDRLLFGCCWSPQSCWPAITTESSLLMSGLFQLQLPAPFIYRSVLMLT